MDIIGVGINKLSFMRNIYYLVWSDAIISFRKHHPDKKKWKIALFIFITWMNALNVWIIFLWLKYFEIFIIPKFSIDIFFGNLLDGVLSFSIEFALPFLILNYFLIFHNNRYESILKRYCDFKPRYAQIYSYFMIAGAFISAVLYGVLTS